MYIQTDQYVGHVTQINVSFNFLPFPRLQHQPSGVQVTYLVFPPRHQSLKAASHDGCVAPYN